MLQTVAAAAAPCRASCVRTDDSAHPSSRNQTARKAQRCPGAATVPVNPAAINQTRGGAAPTTCKTAGQPCQTPAFTPSCRLADKRSRVPRSRRGPPAGGPGVAAFQGAAADPFETRSPEVSSPVESLLRCRR